MTNSEPSRLDRLEQIVENHSQAIGQLINLAREQSQINAGLIEQQQNTQTEIQELRAGIDQLYQIVMRRENPDNQ